MSPGPHDLPRSLITVGSMLLAYFAVQWVLQAVHGRADRRLKSFASPLAQADEAFPERLILPVLHGLGRGVRRFLSPATLAGIRGRLLAAGVHRGLEPEEVLAAQILLALVAGATVSSYLALSGTWRPVALALATAVGFQLPAWWLQRRVAWRQASMLRDLPATLDLMVVCADAGLNLSQALAVTAQRTPGPLGEELGRCVQQVEAGTPSAEALRRVALRSGLGELEALTNAILRADNLGTPIAGLLRDQAEQARHQLKTRVETRIALVPLKLTLVTVFFFLPVLLLITVVPNLINFATRW
ncbi:MAG: type II secretion system F family protein [Actinobacteria bacterium]|nr:type II secretion system F family protein [Actinomycetota bacterium]